MKSSVLLPLLVLLTCLEICTAQEQPFTLRLTFGHGDEEASQWTGSVSAPATRRSTEWKAGFSWNRTGSP